MRSPLIHVPMQAELKPDLFRRPCDTCKASLNEPLGDAMPKLILALLACTAFTAHAEMYKCTNAKGATEYSDTPCAGVKTQVLGIQNNPIAQPQRQGNSAIDELTTEVAAALAEKDYAKADRLAVTSQQRLMIANARASEPKAKPKGPHYRGDRQVCTTQKVYDTYTTTCN